ncbi:MAG: diacylglycerol kinase [Nibricoccus sp.]
MDTSSRPALSPGSSSTPPAPEPPGSAVKVPVKRRNFRNFIASIRYSIDGFREALRHEPSFREDLLFAAALVPFAIILPVNAVSTALMIGSLFLIIIVELLNSAIEWTIDYLRPEHHPLAKRIKDMASAAVFLSYLNCLAIWAVILWPGSGVWKRLAQQFG